MSIDDQEIIRSSVESFNQRDIAYKDSINKKLGWIAFRQKMALILNFVILLTATLLYYDIKNSNEVARAFIDVSKKFTPKMDTIKYKNSVDYYIDSLHLDSLNRKN